MVEGREMDEKKRNWEADKQTFPTHHADREATRPTCSSICLPHRDPLSFCILYFRTWDQVARVAENAS